MFKALDWTLHIRYDDQDHEQAMGKPYRSDSLFLDVNWNPLGGRSDAVQFQLTVHPKKTVRLQRLAITAPYTFLPHHRLFANGYQSWSLSKEVAPGEGMPTLRKIGRPFFKYYGDEWMNGIPRGRNHLHSWSWSYVREQGQEVLFFGSLNESSGFTRIQYDTRKQEISLVLDIDELELGHSYPALEMFLIRGSLSDILPRWRNMLDLGPIEADPQWAWNSWYRFYRNIQPEILREEIHHAASALPGKSWFQIDDGYQEHTGDWLKVRPEFKGQMRSLARTIKDAGMRPGIWIAPFVCSGKSSIFHKHKEWLLKGAKGRPLKAGYNPLWGGWYYALNPSHPAVREYLTGVFHVVIKQWGYELIKLDFLFAAALVLPGGKTRGQVMHEAIEFLRNLAGPKITLLGCGVPLASCIGLVDICRVGPDVHLSWDHSLLRWLRKRERVSTLLAIETVLSRWHTSRNFFLNDPDVYLLRKDSKLTKREKELLYLVTLIAGDVHFTSDNLAAYDLEQKEQFQNWNKYAEAEIRDVQHSTPNEYLVLFNLKGVNWELAIQLDPVDFTMQQVRD